MQSLVSSDISGSIGLDRADGRNFPVFGLAYDNEFAGSGIDARQSRDVDLMRHQHDRPIEVLAGKPLFERLGFASSALGALEERIENGQLRHRTEPKQSCRFQTAAPLARKYTCRLYTVFSKASADARRLFPPLVGEIPLRAAVSNRELRRIARARCNGMPQERDVSFRTERPPKARLFRR